MSDSSGGWLVPPEVVEALLAEFEAHPPRPLSDDVFRAHAQECPPCHCARHCRCFEEPEP